jgi:hypothetical protein
MREVRNAYKILVEKLERAKPLEKSRSRWVGIKIDHKEVGSGGEMVKWRMFVNTVMTLRVPQKSEHF